jgi:hypothetical protein
MKLSKELQLLLSNIDVNNTNISRKARLSDFEMERTHYDTNTVKDKIKSYRMQEEYGAKKFIKP